MHRNFINKDIDRLLSLALLLIILASVYGLARYFYFEQLVEMRHQIELKKKRNAKIESILSGEKELLRQINQQKLRLDRNRLFLKNNQAATAITELQNDLKKIITKNSKARIQAIRPFPVSAYDDYSEASIEVRINSLGHQDLQRILYQIENHLPVLLIHELDIKLNQQRYSTIVAEQEKDNQLVVTLVVSGYFTQPENLGS